MKNILFYLAILSLFVWSSCNKYEEPSILTISPVRGPVETLITIEGSNFEDITSLSFNDGVPANFNPSYGSENAVLFRVPLNAPIGDNVITIETKGGTVTTEFKVTLDAPKLTSFYPVSGEVGGTVTFLGENFFEPIEVLFFDSIAAPILFLSPDSMVVEIPENVEKGFLKIKANGGDISTNVQFFTVTNILVNNFDGEGVRSETNNWLFYGSILQTSATTAVRSSNPVPIDNNFLKLSGVDPGSVWIGGTESHAWDINDFDVFPIESDLTNTFLEMDLNNNGRDASHVVLILTERNGSANDFTYNQDISQEGWHHISIPLSRFEDVSGLQVNPQIIKNLKIHLVNNNMATSAIEANVDNIKFVQVN